MTVACTLIMTTKAFPTGVQTTVYLFNLSGHGTALLWSTVLSWQNFLGKWFLREISPRPRNLFNHSSKVKCHNPHIPSHRHLHIPNMFTRIRIYMQPPPHTHTGAHTLT